jgi:hypothetical protein
MVRKSVALALVAMLTASSSALADPSLPGDIQPASGDGAPTQAGAGPLAPGGAAGVRAAQNGGNLNAVAIGAAIVLVAAGIYLAAGTHYHVPGQSASGTK